MNLTLAVKEMFKGNEMNIYKNDNNEVFMTREQIGQALDYMNPRQAIKTIHARNRERLDRLSRRVQIDTPSGKQETIIYNEKGIYEIIRWSRQTIANEFYDWIYDLLSGLRKGEIVMGSPKPNSTKALLQASLEHEERLETVETDVNYLKDSMRISSREEGIIQNKAKRVVVEALGGKKSNAYKTMNRKTFSRFWGEFKRYFVVARYGDVPIKELDNALAWIDEWQPDTSTRMEIKAANEQISLEDDVS